MKAKRIAAILAWVTTAVFVLTVVVPLTVQRLSLSDYKSLWVNFQLKDEDGRRHTGWVALANIIWDAEFAEYGYEAPEGTDISQLRQTNLGVSKERVKEINGFDWSDKGFLWGNYKTFGEIQTKEGTRLELDHKTPVSQQLEITEAGAPWDIYSPVISFFGRYPNYDVKFDNNNFKLDLKLSATIPRWETYNGGFPYKCGDFGVCSTYELPVKIKGEITHKGTGKNFKVDGVGLMEDAMGIPYSWIAWGGHDWTDLQLKGNWSGSLYRTTDDWQWGYHPTTQGWIWDPIQHKALMFTRVDLRDVEYYTNELNRNIQMPKRALWRAIGPEATLELDSTNVSYKPGEVRLPFIPFAQKMAHGQNLVKARLIRRDGTVVDLGSGYTVAEHWMPLIPDYVFYGPLMLALMVLVWSGYAAAIRHEAGLSKLPSLAWCCTGLFGVWALYIAWAR